MIDRMVNQGLNQPQESFYFQLIPISLTLVNTGCDLPAQGTTYRFSVFKGAQKFDENRIPISADFALSNGLNVLPISSCRLNFYLPSVPKARKIEFGLRVVQRQNSVDYPLGDYAIDANALIASFKDDNISRHELKSSFSEDYELEFEIYVDNNRVALEKNIRDHRQDRAVKSPLRVRKEDSTSSARKGFTQDKKVEEPPQRDNQRPKLEQTPQKEAPTTEPIPQPEAEVTQVAPPAPEPERFEEKPYEKPVVRERSQKAASIASRGSGAVPSVKTKFKPVSKLDTPSEIKKTDSSKMGQAIVKEESGASGDKKEGAGDKLFMTLFLLAGMLTIYWAMLPSSKV